jgi:hypothetical protein
LTKNAAQASRKEKHYQKNFFSFSTGFLKKEQCKGFEDAVKLDINQGHF